MRTRLNETHRSLLRKFAQEHTACPKEQKARDKTYERASRLVREAIEKRFPPADMAVLLKYEVAAPDLCIQGGSPSGQFVGFEYTAAEDAPTVPRRYCSSRSIPFTQTAVDAIESYTKAKDACEIALTKKLDAYSTLIRTARTFEEVVDVWPAVAALREQIVVPSTALIALSPETVDFIRSDNAGANAFAEAA